MAASEANKVLVALRKKPGGDFEALATDGLPVLVEILGFSDESYTEAVDRLEEALEYLGVIPERLHIQYPDGSPYEREEF